MTIDTPNIRSIQADKKRLLIVTWKDGAESVVDVPKHVTDFTALAPLRTNDELFRSVTVGEWGWCAHWSDEIEISADTLWRLALEQARAT